MLQTQYFRGQSIRIGSDSIVHCPTNHACRTGALATNWATVWLADRLRITCLARSFAIIELDIVQEGCLPLYEYRCVKCGALIEKIQKFSDPPLTTCEKCGGRLERLVSPPAIQFKGTGWYVTDYARKSSSLPSQSAEKSDGGDKPPKTSTTETSKKNDVSKVK